MTSIIGLVLFVDKDDKKKWDKEYAYVKKSIDYLEQISQELYGNNFRISPKWQYIKELCIVKRDKPVVYFGRECVNTYYNPTVNPTIEEMLGWMDIADEILKRKREFDLEQERAELIAKAEQKRRELLKQEEERKKNEAREREEVKQREFEYKKQLKFANHFLILFFIGLVIFILYLIFGSGG